MSRVPVIGATGHIGTYLVPRPFAEMCDLTVVRAANGQSPNGRRPSRRLTIEGTIHL
jgi:hypothetical protein